MIVEGPKVDLILYKNYLIFFSKTNCFMKNAKIVLTHNLSIKFIAKDNTTFLDKQKDISFFMTKH